MSTPIQLGRTTKYEMYMEESKKIALRDFRLRMDLAFAYLVKMSGTIKVDKEIRSLRAHIGWCTRRKHQLESHNFEITAGSPKPKAQKMPRLYKNCK